MFVSVNYVYNQLDHFRGTKTIHRKLSWGIWCLEIKWCIFSATLLQTLVSLYFLRNFSQPSFYVGEEATDQMRNRCAVMAQPTVSFCGNISYTRSWKMKLHPLQWYRNFVPPTVKKCLRGDRTPEVLKTKRSIIPSCPPLSTAFLARLHWAPLTDRMCKRAAADDEVGQSWGPKQKKSLTQWVPLVHGRDKQADHKSAVPMKKPTSFSSGYTWPETHNSSKCYGVHAGLTLSVALGAGIS